MAALNDTDILSALKGKDRSMRLACNNLCCGCNGRHAPCLRKQALFGIATRPNPPGCCIVLGNWLSLGYKNKTTPDLSIVKRLGGSRAAKVSKDLHTTKYIFLFHPKTLLGRAFVTNKRKQHQTQRFTPTSREPISNGIIFHLEYNANLPPFTPFAFASKWIASYGWAKRPCRKAKVRPSNRNPSIRTGRWSTFAYKNIVEQNWFAKNGMEHKDTKTQSFIFWENRVHRVKVWLYGLYLLYIFISPCLCASVFNIKD